MKVRFAFVAGALLVPLLWGEGPWLGDGAARQPGPGTAVQLPPGRVAMVERWGNFLAEDQNLAGIDLSEDELDVFRAGFLENLRGHAAPVNLRDVHFDLEALKKARLQKRLEPDRRRNISAAAAHFLELETHHDVERLAGGEVCEIIRQGRGASPSVEQTVRVRYVGRLLDGTEFTAVGLLEVVLVAHREPFPGWMESLTRLRPGGALRLHLPPSVLGDEWIDRGVPPGAAVIFEIELLAVEPTPADALANALLPLAPEVPPPPSAGYTVPQLVETWGWIAAQKSAIAECALTADEQEALTRGLIAGMRGGRSISDAPARDEVAVFVKNLREAAAWTVRQKQEADNADFFRKLAARPGLVLTSSGLRYEITRPGHGPPPEAGQIVTVRYTGRLIDGTVFDSTHDDPVDVPFDKVMPGWTEGIRKLGTGGAIKLYLPPTLGYGEAAVPRIPPGSVLIFEIELLAIRSGN